MTDIGADGPGTGRTGVCIIRVEAQPHSAPLVTVAVTPNVNHPVMSRSRHTARVEDTLAEVRAFLLDQDVG